jgi:polyisoprenoid-binding protein YceI
LILLLLAGAACGGPEPQPTSTAPAGTSVPSSGAASATAQPTTAGPATSAGSSTASPAAALSIPAGSVAFQIDPARSQANYRVREQLANVSAPSDAVGKTSAISGAVVVRPDGSIDADHSKIVVDLRTLKSDESRRDNFIQGSTLQTNRYPNAEFVPTEVQGLPSPLPTSGQYTVQLIGNMTIHGVTKPISWQMDATFADNEVHATGSTSFVFEDFGMSPPRVALVLSVQDNIKLELSFTATKQTG